MMYCIKLVHSDESIEYLLDILSVKVDNSTKKATIVMTDITIEHEITYLEDDTWDRLVKDIDRASMCQCPITVYEDEATLQDIIDAENDSRRKPGEN